MSRFIDRLRAQGVQYGPWDGIFWRDYFRRVPEVLALDAVAEYFFARPEKWKPSEFPCLAPPWPVFFAEFRVPASFERHFAAPHADLPISYGVACRAYDLRAGERLTWEEPLTWESMARLQEERVDVRWLLHCLIFAERVKGESHGPLAEFAVFIQPEGTVRVDGEVTWGQWRRFHPTPQALEAESVEQSETLVDMAVYPVLLALSFLHCKNVTRTRIAPPAKLSAAHQRKRGVPLARYSVLNIDPMKTVLRTEGQSETLGLKHALHICRGHFADYTQGGGLFGKHHGVYWMPQHVKGAAEAGAVVKDYAITVSAKEKTA